MIYSDIISMNCFKPQVLKIFLLNFVLSQIQIETEGVTSFSEPSSWLLEKKIKINLLQPFKLYIILV